MRVLYAEDDDTLRQDFAEVLRCFFPELLVAKDGVEAKKLYDAHAPSMIITDISMPLLDGLSLAEYIKKVDPCATIIVTTAYNTPPYLTKALDIHVDKFWLKPIDFHMLKAFIHDLIPTLHKKYQTHSVKNDDIFLTHLISQKLDIGICLSNKKGKITHYNRYLANLFGYSFQELTGKDFSVLFHDEEKEMVEILHVECFKIKTGKEMPIKWNAIKKDGTSLYVSLSVSLINTHTHETYLLTTVQDITSLVTIEYLEHEHELLLQKKRLENQYATRLQQS